MNLKRKKMQRWQAFPTLIWSFFFFLFSIRDTRKKLYIFTLLVILPHSFRLVESC